MKTTVMACAVGMIFTLGGCATHLDGGGASGGVAAATFVPTDCPRHFTRRSQFTCAGSCSIRVQVVWNAATRTCEVEAENDKTIVSGFLSRQVNMKWELVSAPDWEFRNDAAPFAAPIMFKMPPQQPDVNFKKGAISASTAELVNLMVTRGTFNYSIRVYHRRTGTAIEVDPALFNDF